MGISCGATLIKYVLFLFNLLWLVLGGVVIWLGITVSTWSSDIHELVDINMKAGSISILVTGILIFLVAFLGCCGACKENSCMLSTYGSVILILVVIQCVGVYFAFKYRNNVDELRGKILTKISEKVNIFNKGDNKEVNRLVQEIQKTFQCCGTKDYNDYRGNLGDRLPSSCCAKTSFNDRFSDTCSVSEVQYKDGCGAKMADTLIKYLGGLGGVAIALILIQLLIILSACCLAREVRD